MLAEPKTRIPWTLNPRGSYWTKDKNKFGLKMLETMGWKEGKGLGKHENGVTEHIKLDYKCNNKGLGFKSASDEPLIASNEAYEQVLSELSRHHSSVSSIKSNFSDLEKNSKKFRNRVHYHKFINAKNLSNFTRLELASIFPEKRESLNTEKTHGLQVEMIDNKNNESDTFTSSKNLYEYFKCKMQKSSMNSESISKDKSTLENTKFKEELTNNSTLIDCSFNKLNSDRSINQFVVENRQNKIENIKLESEDMTNILSKDSKDSNQDLELNIISKNDSEAAKRSETCLKGNTQLLSTPKNKIESSIKCDPKNKKWKKQKKHHLKLPFGYFLGTPSVSESVSNFDQIYRHLKEDKILNTSNLISLNGYGFGFENKNKN